MNYLFRSDQCSHKYQYPSELGPSTAVCVPNTEVHQDQKRSKREQFCYRACLLSPIVSQIVLNKFGRAPED